MEGLNFSAIKASLGFIASKTSSTDSTTMGGRGLWLGMPLSMFCCK